MRGAVLLRRTAVFALTFGAGIAVLAWSTGGLFPETRLDADAASNGSHTRVADTGVVPVAQGAGLGPGRGGRLDRDGVAIVRDQPVTWRELTATWGTSSPVPSAVPGVSVQRLGDARFVFYPQPDDDRPDVLARDDASGVTIVTGDEALLRRKENAPASVHAEGNCVATQVLDDGETMVLRSDVLDLRTEERGKGKAPIRIVETDRAVRIEGGGSVVTGTGLLAEFDTGGDAPDAPGARRAAARRIARIEKDVQGLLRGKAPAKAGATAPEIRIACDGAADVETLDRPGRDRRQPWRTTYRDNVRVEETATSMTAERVVVEFVRTGSADRAAGAGSTEIRSVTATGSVHVDGRDPASAYHARCERLRRFAEDARTDVTILEGAPVLTWQGRPQNAAADAPLSTYEVRCKGPVTIRERRDTADRNAASVATIAFEGDVVAVEKAAGTDDVRSETRAPLVTIECRRAGTGRLDPRVLRAEQGATARYRDFAASAQTITAVAADSGAADAMQHVALVGAPVAKYNLHAGGNPLGGKEDPGVLVITSGGRIDADLAPEPAAGRKRDGPRATTRVTGGMVARKMTGDRESWRLTSRDGDARIGWDGGIEEMHAVGAARLAGATEGSDGRKGDLAGDRITVTRSATGAKPSDPAQLDVLVEGIPEAPARAVFGSDEILAARLVQSDDGKLLVARTGARARLRRSGAAGSDAQITAEADEMRVDLDLLGDGTRRPRVVTAAGRVVLGDDYHRVTGDRVTYQVQRGEAEATGKPARLVRSETAVTTLAKDPFPSYASGPVVRVWFDPDEKKPGADRFLRASLPQGGEIVAYEAKPARERVTTTCRGPLELTRTAASCVQQVVCVYESQRLPTDTEWNNDARIDCSRLDMTFDPTAHGAGASSRIRTLVATGTPDDPAQIHTRSPAGDREAYAEAERIEGDQASTTLHLSCPSARTSVALHEFGQGGRRGLCDEITFNYVTFEWTNMLRWRGLE